MPIVRISQTVKTMQPGERLRVLAGDPAFKLARESGVRMVVCQTSMTVMGITKDELIQGVEYGGVAACLDAALDAGLVMFI